MKKLCILFVLGLFSGAVMADADKWHNFSKGKDAHAKEGCASKDKMAKFHKFHPEKGQQVKAPNQSEAASDKPAKEPTLDQFI